MGGGGGGPVRPEIPVGIIASPICKQSYAKLVEFKCIVDESILDKSHTSVRIHLSSISLATSLR